MWTMVTIILGTLALFFVLAALLLEITKIRRALEHIAYRKEIHEIIETDFTEDDDVSAEPKEPAETNEDGTKKPASPTPAPVKRYRKTKIKVVAEGE